MALRASGPVKLIVAIIIVVGGVFGGLLVWDKYVPKKAPVVASVAPNTGRDLPNIPEPDGSRPVVQTSTSTASASAGVNASGRINVQVLKWNAGLGLLLANGGPCTTKESVMYRHGVKNLCFVVEDDMEKYRGSLSAFANALKSNPQPTDGVHFISFMGDAGGAILTPLQETLLKLGPEYGLELVGSPGKSLGEDKCMGPPSWSKHHGGDPKNMRGGVIVGVKGDGDINTCFKFIRDNGLAINPSEEYYDPDSVNFIYSKDNDDAAAKYVTGFKATLKVTRNGKHKPGDTVTKEADGAALWTPADGEVVLKRGGLVTLASTKEYNWQMPMVLVGVKKWNNTNPSTVIAILEATLEAGKQIKQSDEALRKASRIAAEVFAVSGAGPQYWYEMFKGKEVSDSQGNRVTLGGSKVHDLADNLHLFGMKGTTNLYEASYNYFAELAKHYYSADLPKYVPLHQILNTRYIQAIAARTKDVGRPDLPTFEGPITREMARKSYTINFEVGSAKLTSDAERAIDGMHKENILAGGAKIKLAGHTDITGTPQHNMTLSRDRAAAVRMALEQRDPVNYRDRIDIEWFGQEKPVCSEKSAACFERNRRVEVILGN